MNDTNPALDADAGIKRTRGEHIGERVVQAAELARSDRTTTSHAEDDEETSLLGYGQGNERTDGKSTYFGDVDFAGMPWYKRPSIFWVLPPFFLTTMAFGGVLPPKLNLMQEMICREYIKEQSLLDPNFFMAPVDFDGGANDQCRTPAISAKATEFTLVVGLISGILSAVVAPHLGAMSDRYGRKPLLIATSLGTVCSEIISVIAATNPETFPIQWFYLGSALDGLSGSFTVAIAIANAYATDCTPPAKRNVSFAMFHAALFTGLAIGPIVAGKIVQYTGKLATIFWVLLFVHLTFGLFIATFVPESLPKKRQLAARERHAIEVEKSRWAASPTLDFMYKLATGNILSTLKIFWPTGKGSSPALRRNLVALAAVDTIAFGVAMGTYSIILLYTYLVFGWKTPETSEFMSVVNGARVVSLLIILPLLVRFFRGPEATRQSKHSGSDLFDLSIIRLAIFFDTLGYLGYALARDGHVLMVSGAVAALGGMGSPTLQAALTKHVPADRTGQMLGAIGLLHALARVVSPIVFSGIYATTVVKYPQAVFVSLTVTFGLAFVISWFIRPHVHWDEIENEQDEHES